MKKKESKLIIFITIIIVIYSTFIYIVFKPYEYKQEYFINEYKVEEKFNKQDKYYTFTITNGNEKYVYLIENKYSRKRELIQEIEIAKIEDEICILPKSNKITFYPLCNSDNNIYAYNLSNIKDLNYKYNKIKNFNEEYKNIKLNKLNDISFLLYNYKGFYLINEKDKKDIQLFNKDIYTIQLIYQQDQYLLVPDYNQSYFFNKVYVINILNGKIKEIINRFIDYYMISVIIIHILLIERSDSSMPRKSVKEKKTIYQMAREEKNYSREKASELLEFISSERIERIENGTFSIRPEEVLIMSEKYEKPDLCNHYCSNECPIGKKYVPKIRIKNISEIILEMLSSLNAVNENKNRLIDIAVDGIISDNEIEEFISIQEQMERINITVETLQLWVEKMLSNGKINKEKYERIKEQKK